MDEDVKRDFENVEMDVMEIETEILNAREFIINNKPSPLNRDCSPEELRKKQQLLCSILGALSLKNDPLDSSLPDSQKLLVRRVLKELYEGIDDAQKLLSALKAQLSDVKKDVSRLEAKKRGLERMKEAYLNRVETKETATFAEERAMAMKVYHHVKEDLHAVVEAVFPDDINFQHLLADLTRAYIKGGVDVYVDVTPETIDYVNYLTTADLIVYHQNDRSKVRLAELF